MATLRRQTPDLLLLLAILALLGLGLVMVASAGSIKGLGKNDVFHYIKHQIVFAAVGLLGLLFMMRFDYRHLRKFVSPLAVLAPVLLILVLIFGTKINGARNWIDLKFFNFQSSEFAKLAMVIVIAHYLTELGDNVKRFRAGILIPMLYTGFLALLIAKSPDFGAVIVLLMTFFCILFTSGVRVGYLLAIFVPAISGLMFAAVKLEYIRNRIIGFLHPDKDPLGKGYQILQSLMALGSGGLFGVGVGRSRAKFNYLPEAHTDYIFSIVGEELGLIGTVFVVTMLFFIIWRGFKAAMGAKDVFGTLLGAGIVCMIGTQAILNIGVVTSSLPVTGVTLPLLSYGGSSLIVTLTGLGILLNISRQAK